jgi:D-alanyl-D-alanine carboxypeptidase
VQRDGRSIVAVVLGGNTGASRNKQMTALINKYLPKASRGGDSIVVAKSRMKTDFDTPQEVADAEDTVPAVPQKRPVEIASLSTEDQGTRRIATAHVVSSVDEEEEGGSENIAAIEKKLREISSHKLPVPSPAPSNQIDPIVTAAAEGEAVDASAYAPEEPQDTIAASAIVSGWQVQIGAAPSLEAANTLLEKARSRAPGLLAQLENHTETVAKGGATLYRARFAGFQSKNDAQSACNQLKKKKFDCIAISN